MISEEEKSLISKEEEILKTTIDSLASQQKHGFGRLGAENIRARTLTAELVLTRRAEDKQLLASDEAVSHALIGKKKEELKNIDLLLKNPYFARFEVQEIPSRGGSSVGEARKIEYKLGFVANPDCRIMDWRKAPISKLYYEYKEGDEYFEEIQGREREGTITLRHALEISAGALTKVSGAKGTFVKKGEVWEKRGEAGGDEHQSGTLPHILSLITPEQFKTISEESTIPLLIQGVAGSGKTTVALHRLAWLLHEENSALLSSECLVLVLSQTLKRYITGLLPAVGAPEVKIQTFAEWAAETISHFMPAFCGEDGRLQVLNIEPPLGVQRVKTSMALLRMLESERDIADPYDLLIRCLSNYRQLIELDETKLLDREVIDAALSRTISNREQATLEACDLAFFMRALELREKQIFLPDKKTGHLGHLVADEVQDMSALELACIFGGVKKSGSVTLVGDTSQALSGKQFVGWEKLRSYWGLKDSLSRFITLDVSHRSTQQIMRFANYVQGNQSKAQGREGRPPILFKCAGHQAALSAAMNWLNEAMKRYPNALTCVICGTSQQAKELHGLLEPTFGAALRIGQTEDFSFEEGIVIAPLQVVRGLEFVNVLIWEPDSKFFPADEHGRNLFYTAATRASQNLCMVASKALSALMPREESRLMRVVA